MIFSLLHSFRKNNVIFEMSEENFGSKSNNFKSTPPPKRKVRNPFDYALIERLHKPICSPGMCKIYKNKSKGPFRWDIDQFCRLHPIDIIACNSQFEPSPDPIMERIADEATEQFFSQDMVIPSPLESSKKVKSLLSKENSIEISRVTRKEIVLRNVAAQTVLTFPPVLPPEVEKVLVSFSTFTQDQDISDEYEITANGSMRRKLFIEEHSDIEHYDSEQTDDEIHVEKPPSTEYEKHIPVVVSPDLSQDAVTKGMVRTFGTPLKKGPSASGKSGYRNKILDVVDFSEPCFSPIHFKTPVRTENRSATSSSFASSSISPVNKITSSDEEKNNFTSPESDNVPTLDTTPKTPNKLAIKRSASLKESPPKSRKSSICFSEKRSLSMSSLNRSRSVQKLDFSMDMSVDGSFHENLPVECVSPEARAAWSLSEETRKTRVYSHDILDETPIKTKTRSNVLCHEISKIRGPLSSPANMSLDNSIDENPLCLENNKIDFNTVDLKFLTEIVSRNERAHPDIVADSSVSFKRIDSGFNENTSYANSSSYYESAIKPSELTVTDVYRANNTTVLKEISNVNWMRVDSGFKEETTGDSVNFYHSKDVTSFNYTETKLVNKENEFDRFLVQNSNKNEAMSMSDIFSDEVTLNRNFSSTPSKNETRNMRKMSRN